MTHPAKNTDLHGAVPDNCPVAVLLLDVINAFDFPEAEKLLAETERILPNLQRLIASAREARVPVIYLNDNFGRWRSDFRAIVQRCIDPKSLGHRVVAELEPGENDYFVLKPKHSGFFATTLDVLLDYLGAKQLVIAGLTGDMCVMFTAHDAYLRDFHLIVPQDCIASASKEANDTALAHLTRILKADTRPIAELDFAELLATCAESGTK